MNPEQNSVQWNDYDIEKKTKDLLKERRNGKYIPLDIVSHLEYFYNTLNCAQKAENPFRMPINFPALLFEEDNEGHEVYKQMAEAKHQFEEGSLI